MNTLINEPISVITIYNSHNGSIMPVKLNWQGKTYSINKLGYHHKFHEGKILIHIFAVANSSLAFRLRLDSDNLHWTLEEISDGNPN